MTRRIKWLASRERIIRLFKLPVRVEHVRYVSKPCIDPLDKALAMARQMNRGDLVGRIENVRAGK